MAQDKKVYICDEKKEWELIDLVPAEDPQKVMEQLVALDGEEDKVTRYGEQQLAHLFGAHTIAAQLPQGAGALLAYVLTEMCHFAEITTPATMAQALFTEVPARVIHGINTEYYQPQKDAPLPHSGGDNAAAVALDIAKAK